MRILILSLIGLSLAFGAAGEWKQVGTSGAWKNTLDGVVLSGTFWTVEPDGVLYATPLKTGKWKSVGDKVFANTRMLWASENDLISLEKDGSLYRINTFDGTWKGIGKKGEWKGTKTGDCMGKDLFTIESDGKFYRTDLKTGSWNQVGKQEWQETVYIVTCWDFMAALEKGGTLYRVNPKDTSYDQLGKKGEWGSTIAACSMGDSGKFLFTVESDGTLYKTDMLTGKYVSIGKKEYQNTRMMFWAGDGRLLTLEQSGTLYLVDIQ